MRNDKKLLFLVPAPSSRGGINNYFQVLKGKLSYDVFYFTRGARTWPYRKNFFKEIFRALKDLQNFRKKIRTEVFDLVQTSTSLSSLSIIRDGLFILLAKRHNIKVIVFFRGWHLISERLIERRFLPIFKRVYFNTDACITLSDDFKQKLIEWGYPQEIFIETTIAKTPRVKKIDKAYLLNKYKNNRNSIIYLLFLARIEPDKGIYVTLDVFNILKINFPFLKLNIAGDGKELDAAKKYTKENGIHDVTFLGHVTQGAKEDVFTSSHIFIFPSSHGEGMPNAVLEAMVYGLPVVSRPIGGLKQIIVQGKNGYLTESKDPKIIADITSKLLIDWDNTKNIALNNYSVARKNFTTPAVVKRLEVIYDRILK